MRKAFFLTSGPPVPIVGARRIRDSQIISLLAQRMPVELLCVSKRNDVPSMQANIHAVFGENVNLSCHVVDERNLLSRGMDLVRPHFAQGRSRGIESCLRSMAQPGDVVWLSRLRMAKYVTLARSLGCHSVLDEHQIESDLLFDNAFSRMRYWPQGIGAARCARYEKKLSYAADLVVTASPIDASRMGKLAPNSKVQVLPHGIDTERYSPQGMPSKETSAIATASNIVPLTFIGNLDYQPNLHALEWMRGELLPRLEACLQGAELKIRVQTRTQDLDGLIKAFPEFDFFSYERNEQLLEHLKTSTAAIFPLRYGRGNRIHILEAIAAGVPVITTGRGADGLALNPLQELCIAEEPDEFASLVLRVCRESGFRHSMIEHGMRAVRAQYDWSHSSAAMDDIFTELGIA